MQHGTIEPTHGGVPSSGAPHTVHDAIGLYPSQNTPHFRPIRSYFIAIQPQQFMRISAMQAQSHHRSETRVAVIDDHMMINELITTVVDSVPDCRMVGWARCEKEAIELCQQKKPDVILLDLALEETSGLSVLKKITPICPEARVLIFSGNLNSGIIQQALAAGAIGVVSKGSSLAKFRDALRATAAGNSYFCDEASVAIKQLVTCPDDVQKHRITLTPRQQSVLRYVAQGFNSRQIAHKLGISIYTVINHRNSLMKKTGLHRAAQLSLFAADRGLVEATFTTPGKG